MGKLEGMLIQNFGSLKSVKLGKTFGDQKGLPLGNMVTIIGPSGAGKSTLAEAFGFIADCLTSDVETACDAGHRGGYGQIISQASRAPLHFELYYRETSNSRPITYELTIGLDKNARPYVTEERLRQRVQNKGWPLSFLHLHDGTGYAFEGKRGGLTDSGDIDNEGGHGGKKVEASLSDPRKLGIVTLGSMKQFPRIEGFLRFLQSWYLCYFTPDSARTIQHASPQPYLDRTGSNLNNVAQYMFRESPKSFKGILKDIQNKLPGIEKIEPLKMPNGQMVLQFWEKGFNAPFFSQKMSDGTLKLFAYYLLLNEHNPRQLVFIEEPENGLYHHYLSDLAAEMRRNVGTGYGKQLFVTTHSPFFVNALNANDVWVLSQDEDGFSSARRASDYDFVKELTEEEVPMGDLWYSRYFG